MNHKRARTKIAVFLGLTFALSFALEGWMAWTHSMRWVAVLMWIPGIVAILCRVVFREGASDISLRITRQGGASWALAWLAPVCVGGVAYGFAWAAGLAHFAIPNADSNGLFRFLVRLVGMLTVGTLVGALYALGEELGWRGYLLTRLMDAEVPNPVLFSGVVWAAWHVPLILSGEYASSAHPWLSAAFFTVDVIAITYIITFVRLSTGSVWSAVLFHAAWNAVIQGVFDYFTHDPSALWVGESGGIVAVTSALFAGGLWFYRGRHLLAQVREAQGASSSGARSSATVM